MSRILYSYYRSSAAFRVRIALALKELDYELRIVNIMPGEDEQLSDSYRAHNPQGRVPYFIDDGFGVAQSTAIIEYLEEVYPAHALLPSDPKARAQVRAIVNIIACDIHPLNNLAVLKRLKGQMGADDSAIQSWYQHWVHEGFNALEALLTKGGRESTYCFGDMPGMADIYLIPQVWNAKRFNVPLDAFPTIARIYDTACAHPAFMAAMPENQPG